MSDGKLYIKVTCSICSGSKMSRNYHNPMEPYKWKRCPYCNMSGETYIEATGRRVLEAAQKIRNEQESTKTSEES